MVNNVQEDGKKIVIFAEHMRKIIPHGLIYNIDNNSIDNIKNVEVRAQEIMGIVYYIDNYKNVYKTEDVLSEKKIQK